MVSINASIKQFMRSAFFPHARLGNGPLDSSKFSGKPWLHKNEKWPTCQNCTQPMALFLQLNLDSLPESLQGEFGTGLLQLFYCINQEPYCELECKAWSPFAKSTLVRVVCPDTEVLEVKIPDNLKGNLWKEMCIISWKEMADYPRLDEGTELGMVIPRDKWEYQSEYPLSRDKLSGWPRWVQWIEYPNCPVCNSKMRLVFQLDSSDYVAFDFGDSGIGHITQCKTHKTQVAFGWACC